mmetsp:Transcript_9292/g.21012  ORF Transcript_9292/g.21012 Transcript_9292/m.21012 type:complete len:106 (+) Transcript_9292:557-874(+)
MVSKETNDAPAGLQGLCCKGVEAQGDADFAEPSIQDISNLNEHGSIARPRPSGLCDEPAQKQEFFEGFRVTMDIPKCHETGRVWEKSRTCCWSFQGRGAVEPCDH